MIRITETSAVVTHTDVHLQRLRFFQSLHEETGIQWDELRSHQGSTIAKGDLFYVARGRFKTHDTAALGEFLERLGSRLVFLIDWNRARKRLRLLVPNERAVKILRWAADHDLGHRAFLDLGGERLVYDALEQAVKTPLRYGEPLHEMIGTDVAQDYLSYVLQTTASGLLKGQSVALIRDQVRAELFNHFGPPSSAFWRMPAVTPASSFSLLAACAQPCAGRQLRAKRRWRGTQLGQSWRKAAPMTSLRRHV